MWTDRIQIQTEKMEGATLAELDGDKRSVPPQSGVSKRVIKT